MVSCLVVMVAYLAIVAYPINLLACLVALVAFMVSC